MQDPSGNNNDANDYNDRHASDALNEETNHTGFGNRVVKRWSFVKVEPGEGLNKNNHRIDVKVDKQSRCDTDRIVVRSNNKKRRSSLDYNHKTDAEKNLIPYNQHRLKNNIKTHIKMEKYKQRADSSRRTRNKSEIDYLFDIINTEAAELKLTPPPSAKKYISIYNDQTEDKNIFNYDFRSGEKTKRKIKVYPKKSNLGGIKRLRGRPLSISVELASSEFNEEGVRINMNVGEIDFDDSLFDVIDQDNKRYFKCPDEVCSKVFPSLSRAKRHYIVHTGHRPFKCRNTSCAKFFSRKDNMLQHERMHCSANKNSRAN